ncbi:hypothetical protein CC80DRAFT_543158 [Byssothecium circinans]|uniref:Uncharacterized protein n=1 Tax=Byssothecium circinans TaxID=147558 RepID=A0A6A5UA67_9PLEO|nr:hypothetical protein CC80DRAFT_543158 [Byssothecium circinans]
MVMADQEDARSPVRKKLQMGSQLDEESPGKRWARVQSTLGRKSQEMLRAWMPPLHRRSIGLFTTLHERTSKLPDLSIAGPAGDDRTATPNPHDAITTAQNTAPFENLPATAGANRRGDRKSSNRRGNLKSRRILQAKTMKKTSPWFQQGTITSLQKANKILMDLRHAICTSEDEVGVMAYCVKNTQETFQLPTIPKDEREKVVFYGFRHGKVNNSQLSSWKYTLPGGVEVESQQRPMNSGWGHRIPTLQRSNCIYDKDKFREIVQDQLTKFLTCTAWLKQGAAGPPDEEKSKDPAPKRELCKNRDVIVTMLGSLFQDEDQCLRHNIDDFLASPKASRQPQKWTDEIWDEMVKDKETGTFEIKAAIGRYYMRSADVLVAMSAAERTTTDTETADVLTYSMPPRSTLSPMPSKASLQNKNGKISRTWRSSSKLQKLRKNH